MYVYTNVESNSDFVSSRLFCIQSPVFKYCFPPPTYRRTTRWCSLRKYSKRSSLLYRTVTDFFWFKRKQSTENCLLLCSILEYCPRNRFVFGKQSHLGLLLFMLLEVLCFLSVMQLMANCAILILRSIQKSEFLFQHCKSLYFHSISHYIPLHEH